MVAAVVETCLLSLPISIPISHQLLPLQLHFPPLLSFSSNPSSKNMDRRLHQAILKGDTPTFLNLIQENEFLIIQTAQGSGNSVLHLVARFGHVKLAAEIVMLRPEMVSVENDKLETPLHEACKEGNMEMVKLLMKVDPWVVYKVNDGGESVLFVACERGRIEVVKLLLDCNCPSPRLLMMELDGLSTSLHVSAANGHTEIVKEILKVRQDFAYKTDSNGCTPLHLACGKGHLEITRELLRLDPDLSFSQDGDDRTPLHWAAIKGRVNIINEILSTSLESAEMVTKNGETVLHLGVKNKQYEAVKYLMETLNITKLLNMTDNDGNTILHLATAGKLTTMVIYLLKLGVDVNALNRKGYTALDVVEADASNSGLLVIVPALMESGAKRCEQLPPKSPDIHRTIEPDLSPNFQFPKLKKSQPESPAQLHRHKDHHKKREKKIEHQTEGLRNARKTIIVVAVLIATVTFAAGINPPGGFNQVTGRAIMGRHTSFKIFMVCNIIAFFLSLGIVIVLVSIIPFQRKTMMKMLSATHKIMWASTSFMVMALVAAIWTIMPDVYGTRWVLVTSASIGGGCMLTISISLGVMLAKHWVRKWEWRKRRAQRKMDGISPHSSVSDRVGEMRAMRKRNRESSSNSDVDSSDQGYHLY